MFVSDKYEFVVAMPTKTGTNSLRAVVDRLKREGVPSSVATLLSGEAQTRHRIAPPPGKEHYDRYMLVRHPVDRLISMYEYLRRKDWEWMAQHILSCEERNGREAAWVYLLEAMLLYRDTDGYFNGDRKAHGIRPYMWTDTLSEMRDFMSSHSGPYTPSDVGVIRLEDVESDWDQVMVAMGVEEDDMYMVQSGVPKRNSTPDGLRLFSTRAEYLAVDGASDLVSAILAGDRWDFGYDLEGL
jgi:hypothetical protein